jgi:hypothetical protein
LTEPHPAAIVGAMTATVVIDERFCGPPASANGGYSCALAAHGIAGPAEVTLRVPPPLGVPLHLEQREDGVALLDPEGTLVAEARPTTVDLDVPPPVSLEQAERAAAAYPWRETHPYPTCFVCGPGREARDGLEIFPGPVDGTELYAAPWTPAADLADASGRVLDAFVWAALDCPSGIVTDRFGEVGQVLLGRLAADLRDSVRAGEPHVVQAWTTGRDGRKLQTASALFSADGALRALARAVWIELASAQAGTIAS